MWYSVLYISLQNQYIAMLHSSISIGIARGQYYWILGALFGIVLTLEKLVETNSVNKLWIRNCRQY